MVGVLQVSGGVVGVLQVRRVGVLQVSRGAVFEW